MTFSRTVSVLLPIYDFYHGNFHDNVLIKERDPTAKKETNLLQDEHQDDEVDKEGHTTNAELVNDAFLSSDDSYNAQTNDNCSEEASCLATDFGSFRNDELEMELFCESCDANMMQESPMEEDEVPT